ncbi:calcineurin-binding protein cabin-1, partial [Nephila pilipes]
LETSIGESKNDKLVPEIPTSQLQSTPWFEISINESKKNSPEISTSQLQSTPMFQTSVIESKKDNNVLETPVPQLQSTPMFETSIIESKTDNIVLETPTSLLPSTPWFEISINDSKRKNPEITTSQLQSTPMFETSINEFKKDHPVSETSRSHLQSTPLCETSIKESKKNLISGILTPSLQSTQMFGASTVLSADDFNVTEISSSQLKSDANNTFQQGKFKSAVMSPNSTQGVEESEISMDILSIIENFSEQSTITQSPFQESVVSDDICLNSKLIENTEIKTSVIAINTTANDDRNESFLSEANDSSSSTNIEIGVIEQCAKEMLEFINKKVEDMVLSTKSPVSFSSLDDDEEEMTVEKIREERKRNLELIRRDFESMLEDNSATLNAEIKDETLSDSEIKDETLSDSEIKYEIVSDSKIKEKSKISQKLKTFKNQLDPLEEEEKDLEMHIFESSEFNSLNDLAFSSSELSEAEEF